MLAGFSLGPVQIENEPLQHLEVIYSHNEWAVLEPGLNAVCEGGFPHRHQPLYKGVEAVAWVVYLLQYEWETSDQFSPWNKSVEDNVECPHQRVSLY